jgi:hypothetical protein
MRGFPLLAVSLAVAIAPAHAGETEIHLRPMHFAWTENISGHSPIRERGALVATGVSHTGQVAGALQVTGLLELWGGRIDYDGYRVEGWVPYATDTRYTGTREEISARTTVALSRSTSLRPFAGLGHRYWQRSRSNEVWNTLFGRLGARVDHHAGVASWYVEAGALVPVRTRVHVDWSNSGYGGFVLTPRNAASAFATFGLRFDRWSLAVTYEAMRFGRSAPTAVSRTAGITGAVLDSSSAYQPDTRASTLGLGAQYKY